MSASVSTLNIVFAIRDTHVDCVTRPSFLGETSRGMDWKCMSLQQILVFDSKTMIEAEYIKTDLCIDMYVVCFQTSEYTSHN